MLKLTDKEVSLLDKDLKVTVVRPFRTTRVPPLKSRFVCEMNTHTFFAIKVDDIVNSNYSSIQATESDKVVGDELFLRVRPLNLPDNAITYVQESHWKNSDGKVFYEGMIDEDMKPYLRKCVAGLMTKEESRYLILVSSVSLIKPSELSRFDILYAPEIKGREGIDEFKEYYNTEVAVRKADMFDSVDHLVVAQVNLLSFKDYHGIWRAV